MNPNPTLDEFLLALPEQRRLFSAMLLGEVASSGLVRGRAVLCDCAKLTVLPRRQVAKVAKAKGKPICLCGETVGDPVFTPLLVGLGFRSFSVSPGRLTCHNMIPAFLALTPSVFRRLMPPPTLKSLP